MTALLIGGACICLNLLLYRSGATGMDDLGGFMLKYQTENAEVMTIEIPPEKMNGFLKQFSQEIYDAKVLFGRMGWCFTAAVTLLSAAIAYFVSGRALQPLRRFTAQAEKINQDSLVRVRLDESTIQEFRQLSHAVNGMLDRLAHSFDLQRQFAGNAAHELRTPLALMQTKLELFCEEHTDADAETMQMAAFQMEQLDRLSALVRTLLSMSNLQSVSRTDEIALALRTDRIDGAESTLPTYVDSGYYQLAPYWTYDRHSYNADVLVASSETWETFSQEEQTIIERCAAEAASWQRDHWQSAEVRAMLHASRSGCYMALLDEEQAEKFRAAVQPIYEHLSDAQKEVVQAVQALADSD